MTITTPTSSPRYQCPRCGAETTKPEDVAHRYCVLCGVHGFELDRLSEDPERLKRYRLPAAC